MAAETTACEGSGFPREPEVAGDYHSHSEGERHAAPRARCARVGVRRRGQHAVSALMSLRNCHVCQRLRQSRSANLNLERLNAGLSGRRGAGLDGGGVPAKRGGEGMRRLTSCSLFDAANLTRRLGDTLSSVGEGTLLRSLYEIVTSLTASSLVVWPIASRSSFRSGSGGPSP